MTSCLLPRICLRRGEDVYWVEEEPVLTTSGVVSPVYVIAGSKSAVRSTVYLYDQYGDTHQSHRTQKADITIGEPAHDDNGAAIVRSNVSLRQVISRGYASWRRTVATDAGTQVQIMYDVRMLARNSDGQAVQGYNPEADSAQDLDDLEITYNDGSVARLQTTTNPDWTVNLMVTVGIVAPSTMWMTTMTQRQPHRTTILTTR